MDRIKHHFERIITIPDSDWAFFTDNLEMKEYAKKETLLKSGETENYFSFVEKGAIRYFIPKKEDDITFGFRCEDEFSSAYDSFLTQKPSIYSLQAMEDCVLWSISYNNLQRIYRQTSVGNLIGRIIAEQTLVLKWDRELSFLNQTAEERYLDIFDKRPELLKRVPLKYLASYIGVTPQALSRIRKRIS
ncbi:Crp/Fnr family transcriptional regulator [Pseudozobellia sp. WGM2]|uniref:Crp/Fnr family transcriptional regulator n=1 Tax=Pseudozobellia sp. WGM2 TaxID=2787625 RepID=UPI001AE0580F|nr:Crp/Fnr family transcriptional regulator [Pseudozobellia sp. WGM2]